MDMRRIADLLRATIDPAQREEAENQLNQVWKGNLPIVTIIDAFLTKFIGFWDLERMENVH